MLSLKYKIFTQIRLSFKNSTRVMTYNNNPKVWNFSQFGNSGQEKQRSHIGFR